MQAQGDGRLGLQHAKRARPPEIHRPRAAFFLGEINAGPASVLPWPAFFERALSG
jgi:hypothetical protein